MSNLLGREKGYNLYELRKELVVSEKDTFGIYHVIKPNTPVTNVGKVVMFVGVTGAGEIFLKLIYDEFSCPYNNHLHLGVLHALAQE